MIKGVSGIYRDEKAKELNDMLVQLLDDLEFEYESLNEGLMDLTMCHSEQREKTFLELLENPNDFNDIVDIKNRQKMLNTIIPRVRCIVFKGYEETIVNDDKYNRMTDIEVREWLGENVKPLILNGEKRQAAIAQICGFKAASTISRRVKRVYGIDWAEYCIKVKEGIY